MLDKIDWTAISNTINSRVGLAVLIMAYTSSPWGLGAKLDGLIRNTDKVAAAVDQYRQLVISDHEMLVRLVERCQLANGGQKRETSRVKNNDSFSLEAE